MIADNAHQSDVLLYFLAIFVPPVPVFIKRGCGADFLISICLSILGWIPGVLLRNLALQYPASALNTGPLLIYLTARDASRGQAALKTLEADDQLLKAKVLQAQGGPVSLAFKELDVSKNASIDAFARDLQQAHGSIDVVINNAGIAMDGFDATIATTTLATNYHGTLHATLALLPLLAPARTSRLINIASIAGSLSKYPSALASRFRAAATPSPPPAPPASAATTLMSEFATAVADGSHKARGFPSAAYAVSKAGLIAATKAVAAWESEKAGEEGREKRGVQACSICSLIYLNNDCDVLFY
ncbi:putative carbonyl reductase [Diplodia seriata]|uniref:Putative carbonyl reductase n=1 Tax=Diplodia seriata TaxID=420778 RepID=A0A0G2EQL7_9PEZI|nr:putative carbonyl reductase [Diplodia seriata]